MILVSFVEAGAPAPAVVATFPAEAAAVVVVRAGVAVARLGVGVFAETFLSSPERGVEYCTLVWTPKEYAAFAFTKGVAGANPGRGKSVTVISMHTRHDIHQSRLGT